MAVEQVKGKEQRSVHLVSSAGGVAEKLCDGCGWLAGWSSDGERLVLHPETDSIATLALADRKLDTVVRGAGYNLHAAALSPDDRWIAFHARSRSGLRQVFLAPHRPAETVEEKEWIPITPPGVWEGMARWQADGRALYFCSERDGFRCIWKQPLGGDKRPAGDAVAVAHFHSARRSLKNIPAQWFNLSVLRDALVLNLRETKANIWLARPHEASR
jgi:hypothetical protein